MEREDFILVKNDNSVLSVPSAWPEEPIICQFLGIIIYIGVYGVCFRHFLTCFEFCESWLDITDE